MNPIILQEIDSKKHVVLYSATYISTSLLFVEMSCMHFVCIINKTVNIVNFIKDKLLLAYTSRSNKRLNMLAPEDKV